MILDIRYISELNSERGDAMIPVNLELVKELWLPNIFIYNLKTFKVRPRKNGWFLVHADGYK